MSVSPSVTRFNLLIYRVDQTTYPHFNIYPPCVQALATPIKDTPRPKARNNHWETHNEVTLRISTTLPGDREDSTRKERVSRRPRGLTIVTGRPELVGERSLPSVLDASPPRLLGRVPSLDQFDGQDLSPSRPRPMSPVFDRSPSIETRLSRLQSETVELFDVAPKGLTRSQSLSAKPTTPKRRRSALITQRIKELSATAESPEPVLDRHVRRSTSFLPISPMRA